MNLIQPTPELLYEVLRLKLDAFVERSFGELNPAVPFHLNWHIQAMCWHLEQVAMGNIKRLIINVPPRHLKSFTCSVSFPAWVLGRDPNKKIICASYSRELGVAFSADFRRLIQTPLYRGTFPGVFGPGLKNTEELQLTSRRGSRLTASVGGTITGRGGDIVIIDDPLKADAAMSEAERRSVNDWFRNTLMTRLDSKLDGAIIVTMQRLHEDDVTGNLTAEEGHAWAVLNIPAIAVADEEVRIGNLAGRRCHHRKSGDVIDPLREPLAVLEQIRQDIGSARFEAQYQGNPLPPHGNIFRREWLSATFDEPPVLAEADAVIQSWDTAMSAEEHNDYSVCSTFAIFGESCLLIDLYREKVAYPDLKRAAITLIDHYRPNVVIIERAGRGIALRDELRRTFRGRRTPVTFHDPSPRGDKETRAAGVSAMIERGMVVLPKDARWRAALEKELLSFPSTKYDDQVDSVVQFLRFIQHLRAIPKFDRRTGLRIPTRRD